MAAQPADFKAVLKKRKNKVTQFVLPSMGLVKGKLRSLNQDLVEIEADVGGQKISFFMHYTQVVIAA